MIEKIPFETETITHDGKIMEVQTHASPYDLQVKINELVDAVNRLQLTKDVMFGRIDMLNDAVNELQKDREEIKEWIGIVSDLRSRVPVIESRVSILEEHAQRVVMNGNIQPQVATMSDMKCPFCQRELQEITTSNPLGLGRIEMAVCKKCMDKGVLHIMPIWDWQELIRTRKALEIAVDALKVYANQENWDFEHFYSLDTYDIAADALEQITALEQKDK